MVHSISLDSVFSFSLISLGVISFLIFQVKIQQAAMELQLSPFNVLLRTTLDLLQEKDPAQIFAEPVNLREASTLSRSVVRVDLNTFSVEFLSNDVAEKSKALYCLCIPYLSYSCMN